MPDGQGQTSNIDIASIDHVEVLRGPFSALSGNSSGGVLQVYTEDGRRPPSLSADVSASSYGTWHYGLKANGANDRIDYAVSANRFTSQGYRDHSGARKNLGNVKLDRKSVVSGKSVSVRVDHGGRRIYKKTTTSK